MKSLFGKADIHGMAHITGGGFFENIPRMLKDGQGVEIELDSFEKPAIFDFIQKRSSIPSEEMYNVFNMGIGFVIAAPESEVSKIQQLLDEAGQPSYVIGRITDSGRVELK